MTNKFYPLKNEEWGKAWNNLKPSEIRILYHLRTLDPWGDRELELGVSGIAKDLGIDKGTVSRALRSLADKGWIDLELIKVKVKLKSLSSDNGVVATQHRCEETTPVVATQLQLSDDNSSCPQTTTVVALQRSQPETYTQSEVQIPKTIKTLNTINTLSEGEREKFKAFCKRKGEQLPTRVILLDSWIKKHFEELYTEYQLVYGDKNFITPSKNSPSENSITPSKNSEKVKNAIEAGLLKDIYYSSVHRCDCVVLQNGTPVPVEEWVNAAEGKS